MPSPSKLRPLVAVSLLALLGACGGGDDAPPALAAVPFDTPALAFTAPNQTYDISNYIQTGRYSLPVGSGTNLLAEEASGVTYNKDTDTLFVVGDGGTSIAQVTKQGVLVDSMTLAQDPSKAECCQGTYFYDPEGIAYIGNGKFVLVEERFRQVNEFTYVPNTTLDGSKVRTAKLGTTIGNIGIEGISFDPSTNGYVAVKESGPMGVFHTTIDFATGAASNGSASAENAINLFDPAKIGFTAINDVFALSNIVASSAPDYGHLLILSAPAGKVVKMDRSGNLLGTLDVGSAAQNEGMVMDASGNLYVVSEVGGGAGKPEMLVFAPTASKAAIGLGSNLYLTFNQNVVAGTGSITISNGAGDTRTIAVTDSSQVTISGKTVTINPAIDLQAGSSYSLTYAAGVFKDSLGNTAPAVASTSTFSFTAAGSLDSTPPTLVSTSPVDNATGITSSRILLNFNERVVAGSGNIIISNGTDTRTIAVGDATQVSFSGNTANINPGADLLKGTTYSVTLASGVIRDAAGNPFAGITSTTTLNFATAAAPDATPKVLITEVNSNANGGDFMELYNYGTTPIDLTGWKWDDDSASFSDAGNAAFPAVTLPAGARLVVVNTTDVAAFRAAWGLGASVPVIGTGGPGLGNGDMIVLFDTSGKAVTWFNYSGGSKTASDGTAIGAAGASSGVTATMPNHAGAAFGGSAVSSAVWDGVSTSSPTYRAATVGVLGGFAQPAAATAIGSPGQ
ncbi:hypothetical protein UC35_06740 [Ramlibacter tataouinensis]|uniref:LTD domain-containing protein n=2 Tax=Ramlibacter tataouinensis TaxID=94132 RepID=A0A127JZE5_9BURK|nr:hypothetical protein UC35_06740 [Ramlibacter tataouinensis]